VDAFSLGLPYRSGEPLSPVGETINGKLLTNQTTVIVDLSITTTLFRAAGNMQDYALHKNIKHTDLARTMPCI
jgi:hypothetical protein